MKLTSITLIVAVLVAALQAAPVGAVSTSNSKSPAEYKRALAFSHMSPSARARHARAVRNGN